MKVLIVGTRFVSIPSLRGGAIEDLIMKYVEHNSKTKNNEITVYSPYDNLLDNYDYRKFNNVEFRFVNKKSIYYKILRLVCGTTRKILKNCFGDEFVRSVIKDLKNRNELAAYDKIIILNNINNVTYICKKTKGKHILYLHNDYLNTDTANNINIVKKVDQIWCVSNFIKQQVDRIIDNNKSVVIYNGTDIEEFNKKIEEKDIENLKKKYSIKDDDFVILYTGRIMAEKGVKELLQAYSVFKKNKETTKIFILGGPTDVSKKYYNELIEQYKHDKCEIFFLGRVEHEIFNLIYKIASVQVVPSICNEAFGLTVVEGMAAGIPLIVSDSGGIPELVNDDCALVVKKDNIVKEIIKSLNIIYKNKNEITKTLVNNAKLKVKDFSLDNYFEKFDELLK